MNKRDKQVSICFSKEIEPRFDCIMTPIATLQRSHSFICRSRVQISPLPKEWQINSILSAFRQSKINRGFTHIYRESKRRIILTFMFFIPYRVYRLFGIRYKICSHLSALARDQSVYDSADYKKVLFPF